MKKHYNKIIALFTLPALIVFSLFIIYPLFLTVYYSFFEYTGFSVGEFLGVDNFVKTLQDPVFWLANKNTFKILCVQLFVCGPISFLLALLLLDQRGNFKRFFKVVVFLPTVLNVAVISLMWKMMLSPDWGVLDTVMTSLGLEKYIIGWLSDSRVAIWIIGFVTLWQYLGLNMMYFYSALKSIPESYYESAKLEGANFWQRAFKISIPLTQEMIKFVLLISVTGTLQIFTQVQLLTNGGPGDITRTLIFQMYHTAFNLTDFGQAGAISILFAIETFVIVFIINKFVARDRIELT